MKNGQQWPVKWISHTIHIDIDTGEIITKWNAKKNYKHIKTNKHAKITNAPRTRGEIEWTKLYRHKQQGELPFTRKN